ncbi:MAG TPA: DUF2877 domain-containing protein [Xanthobacteraceae bacterium]|jgi:hypothetical protein|nr:DUF2877 domain-containing protein [Xanthobacteraceae bacterium]
MNVQTVITGEVSRFGALASPILWADTIGCRVPERWRKGRVQAVFERACHIVTDDRGFLAILTGDCGNVAHGIRLKTRPRLNAHVRVGQHVSFADNRITFGSQNLTVELADAEAWQSELRPGLFDNGLRLGNHATIARQLLTQAAARSDSEFLKLVARLDMPSTPLADLVGRQLAPLKTAQRSRDHASALATLANLIGLGPGLTPAGDDFIIGWLAGLTLSASTADAKLFLQEMCEGVADRRHATTTVSAQHLDDACQLQFSERLSNLCIAIGRDRSDTDLRALIDAQLAIGATSGADAAAGLMFALSDLARDGDSD